MFESFAILILIVIILYSIKGSKTRKEKELKKLEESGFDDLPNSYDKLSEMSEEYESNKPLDNIGKIGAP